MVEKKHVSASESTQCMTYSAFEFFECGIVEEPYFLRHFKVIIVMQGVFRICVTLSRYVTHHVTYFSRPRMRLQTCHGRPPVYTDTRTCFSKSELSIAQYINFVLLLGDLIYIIVWSFDEGC